MPHEMSVERNKQVIRDFNFKVIMGGSRDAFDALVRTDFINRSAPPGAPDGREGLWSTFSGMLRSALSNLAVEIHDQIGEGDKVTTRKTISGIHSGALLGVPATGKPVAIRVIDIVRVEDGQYAEHWGMNDLMLVIDTLRTS